VSPILLDSVSVKAQPKNNRDANAKRSGFQSNLSTGTLLSVPFPRSEARRAKGNYIRTLVEPPPSSRCDFCGGELRLKQIESANRTLDLDYEIFVCVKCDREQTCIVSHNHTVRHMPDPKAALFRSLDGRNKRAIMESATFRKWLADRGCHFDHHEHQQRGKGQMMVTVHREGRKTEVPLGGSHQVLDQRVVHRACEELGLDPSQLPGPQSRV
jgi:hypothetical protein